MDLKVDAPVPVHGREPPRTVRGGGLERTRNAYDAREEISRVSRRRPNEREEVRTFLEGKRQMIRSHPHLTNSEKARALANIDRIEARMEGAAPEGTVDSDAGGGDTTDDEPPLPGRVGFGVFYRPPYKVDFDTGTAAEYTILCPYVVQHDAGFRMLYLAANHTFLAAA